MSWRFRRATRYRKHSTMLRTTMRNPKVLSIFTRRMQCPASISSSASFSMRSGSCPLGGEEDKNRKSEESTSWLMQTFSHIEVAPILTLESGRPLNPLTGLDSNQSHAFPLSARPLALGRNSLNTPALATMDFRILKYFPFGGVKRLDVVAEFFNLFNSANVSQINPVFGSGLTPIPEFRQSIAGTGARQIQFSLDFEF